MKEFTIQFGYKTEDDAAKRTQSRLWIERDMRKLEQQLIDLSGRDD